MSTHTLIDAIQQVWHPIDSNTLTAQQIHIWSITLPEQQKKPRFEVLHQLKQERNTILKRVLGFYLNQELQFAHNPHGKPYLLDHALEFNLSHTRNHLFIALHQKPIGVDIEILKPRHVEQFSRRFFGDLWFEEVLQPYSEYLKLIGFFRAWTQTEAWIKAHGETVFQYSHFTPQAFPKTKALHIDKDWQILSFMPKVGLMCSVCCATLVKAVHYHHIDLNREDDYLVFIHQQARLSL